jgi:hypothetical protein
VPVRRVGEQAVLRQHASHERISQLGGRAAFREMYLTLCFWIDRALFSNLDPKDHAKETLDAVKALKK